MAKRQRTASGRVRHRVVKARLFGMALDLGDSKPL
jgi:hypothetical protein